MTEVEYPRFSHHVGNAIATIARQACRRYRRPRGCEQCDLEQDAALLLVGYAREDEAFIPRLIAAADDLDEGAACDLVRYARNHVRACVALHHRNAHRHPQTPEEFDAPDVREPEPVENAILNELIAAITVARDRGDITDRDFAVVVDPFFGHDDEAIAERLNCSPDTVKTTRNRARKKLRSCLPTYSRVIPL